MVYTPYVLSIRTDTLRSAGPNATPTRKAYGCNPHQTSDFFWACTRSRNAGSSSVTFGAGATEQRGPSRRMLDDASSPTPTSTIVVANLGFNVKGRPSSAVDAGTTQVKVSSTSSGQVNRIGGVNEVASSVPSKRQQILQLCTYDNPTTKRAYRALSRYAIMMTAECYLRLVAACR